MNNFQTAQNPRPAPDPDPFALLDRLPRDVWQLAFCRFHSSVRRTGAHPAEVVAWCLRDIESTLADMERAARHCPATAAQVEALRAFGKVLIEFPDEAQALAAHAVYVELMMGIFREVREGANR